jgi:hypothetical protein
MRLFSTWTSRPQPLAHNTQAVFFHDMTRYLLFNYFATQDVALVNRPFKTSFVAPITTLFRAGTASA